LGPGVKPAEQMYVNQGLKMYIEHYRGRMWSAPFLDKLTIPSLNWS
jgi:hypothetical protein